MDDLPPISLADVHDETLERVIERLTARDVAELQRHRDEFVELPCAACRASELLPAFDTNGFSYRRCAACGMLMLSPAPSAARQLEYIRTSEALRHWRENMPPTVRASRERLYSERAAWLRERLARHGGSARRVLEVGAGNGEFAQALIGCGAGVERMILVEPQPLAIDIPGVEAVDTRIEDWTSDERFDLAVSWEVIEHLLDPDPMLAAIRDRLDPGGLLVLSTPNEASVETRALRGRSANLLYDHVRIYNPHTLATLLERIGFEVLEIETPGRLDVEILQRALAAGHVDLAGDPALRFVVAEGDAETQARFQDFLRRELLSGHMRCVAQPRR